ncbi:MAG TPA: hypothetical protein VGO48_16570 [Conexibacter sp.]|jgi:hypothetical protein|nr:hypothetical protein [Conexibacter sp.]
MTILRLQSRRAAVLAALAAALLLVPAAFAATRGNPETKSLPPTANPGYLLGYPTPTYQWHGCTATATRSSLAERVPGAPPNAKGNHQGAVQFTTSMAAPYVSWQAKRGWTICGVQAAAVLDNPTVDSQLLAEVGYTSGRQRGSTARDGRETILVPIKRGAIGYRDFEQFEGKTFTIDRIQDIAVFVKRVR